MSQIVVITGASSGIGHHVAKVFSENGYHVYGLSRSPGNLTNVEYIGTDLTDDDSVNSAFERINKEAGAIDILINNAGSGISGAIEFTDMSDALYQMNLNLFGAVRCIKSALSIMRSNGGKIINISSVAAVYSLPFQAFYSASKSAINALTMSLRNELSEFGNIQVCAIMPGDVKTGFTSARKKNIAGDDIYNGIISASVAGMEQDEINGMNPESMGRYIYKIASKRKLRVFYTAGLQYKLFVLLKRIVPNSFISYALRKMYIKH